MKITHLARFLAAHADDMPPNVMKAPLHGKKPDAGADPDNDQNHEIKGEKKEKALKGKL